MTKQECIELIEEIPDSYFNTFTFEPVEFPRTHVVVGYKIVVGDYDTLIATERENMLSKISTYIEKLQNENFQSFKRQK